MPVRPKVGAQIRRRRQLLDMRQQDLADKLGVSRNTVDSWENDRAYPQRKLAKLEQVLGISLTAEGDQVPSELADLTPPQDEWEARVFADPDLPVRIRRRFIEDSRASRAAYDARRDRSQPAEEDARPGRHRAS